MSDDELDVDVESESEEEDSKKKKKSPAKKGSKKKDEKETKSPAKRKASNKENEKPAAKKKAGDKDAPVKALNETQAGPRLVEYLREQNRPHSAIGIFENLKGLIKKPVVIKLLDKLAENGTLTCKVNGKQKIYFIAQDAKLNLSEEEMKEKDTQITQLTEQLKSLQQAQQQATHEWNKLKNEPTTDELTKQVAEKEKTVATLKAKLATLSGANAVMVTREEMMAITKRFEYYVREWRKRKKAVMQIVDDMSEGAEDGMSREDRLSSFGVDTDEDSNLNVATFEALLQKRSAPGAGGGCKRLKTS